MRRAFVRGALLAPFIFAHEMLNVVGREGEARVDFSAECPPKKNSSSSLPYFMGGGCPKYERPRYAPDSEIAPHIAEGEGLLSASTGEEAFFTIKLVGNDGGDVDLPGPWNLNPKRFIYVWISGQSQLVNAQVTNNHDGTLTARYTVDFPGDYLISVEDVDFSQSSPPGTSFRPIAGSPFALVVEGEPTLDRNSLPLCEGEDGKDRLSEFWMPGSWVSAYVAGRHHGVLREGWVFQPQNCVYDTFSADDLMLLATGEELTWVVFLGGSVQRGVFLSLVDMILERNQKTAMKASAIEKCWGWSNIRIGNLRVTYQDMRVWIIHDAEDLIVCNNEKLASGGTASYLEAARKVVRNVLFEDNTDWPDAILAPAFLETKQGAPNYGVQLLLDVIPPTWDGKLMIVEHMAAVGYHWRMGNPTGKTLAEVAPLYERAGPSFAHDRFVELIEGFENDRRVSVMSLIPLMQPKLWDNEGFLHQNWQCYQCGQHFHNVLQLSDPRTYYGSMPVHSSIGEMLGNMLIAKAVGSKASIKERAAAIPDIEEKVAAVRASPFEVCTDCPDSLLPFHVKYPPSPACFNLTTLSRDRGVVEVWDKHLCPSWCMTTRPVAQNPTQSGLVDVRECKPQNSQS